jgi:CheY-like chemotaxis protein
MSEKLPRLLLVDDDPDLVDRLEQLLDGTCEVVSTTDWATVSRVYFREECALVLMDVNLPVLKGDHLVKILKGSARPTGGKQAPIVLFSASDEDAMQRLAAQSGADGWLSKGLRGAALLEAIERWLG